MQDIALVIDAPIGEGDVHDGEGHLGLVRGGTLLFPFSAGQLQEVAEVEAVPVLNDVHIGSAQFGLTKAPVVVHQAVKHTAFDPQFVELYKDLLTAGFETDQVRDRIYTCERIEHDAPDRDPASDPGLAVVLDVALEQEGEQEGRREQHRDEQYGEDEKHPSLAAERLRCDHGAN